MGHIDAAYHYEDQLGAMWDFIVDSPDITDQKITYKVQDVSIPFRKLTAERKFSGETVFKTPEEPGEFSVTLRESNDFSSFFFFKKWADKFYNPKTRTFKTFPSQTQYDLSLYDCEIAFYKPLPIAIGIPFINNDFSKNSFSMLLSKCKPIGVEPLTLDYSGAPITYSVTFLPETVEIVRK